MRPTGIELALAFVVGLVAWIPSYWSLDGPYVRDDPWIVAENPALDSIASPARFFTDPATQSRYALFNAVTYRPLMTWSLALDVARAGRTPATFRAGNLVLHALTSALGFLLLLRILAMAAPDEGVERRRSVAWVAALLFAAHPISAFSLRYLSNRGLLLVTFFSYATLLSQLGAPESGTGRVRTFLLASLALLSRENAATLPLAIAVLEAGLRPPGSRGAWARRLAPVLGALGLYLLLRLALGQGTDQFGGLGPTASERVDAFLAQGAIHLGTYLPALAWPTGVRWDPLASPATPWPILGAAAWLMILAALASAARARRSVWALALLLYPVSMIPTTLLVQPTPASFYRPYPGSLFAYLGLAWGLSGPLGSRGLLALALPGVVALGLASHGQGQADRDEVAMWTRAARHGLSLRGRHRAAEAEPEAARRLALLDALVREDRSDPRVLGSRGVTRLLLGDAPGAAKDFEAALARGPVRPEWRVALLTAARAAERPSLAKRAGPEPPDSHGVFQLAGAALAAGHPQVAGAALSLAPGAGADDWRVAELRGVVAHQLGDARAAASHYRRALALGGAPPGLHANLGLALRQLDRCSEALPHLDAALRANPADSVARANREACLP